VFPILVIILDIIRRCSSLRADAVSFAMIGFAHDRSAFQLGHSRCQ
jgi:hypothetical protein